MKGGYPYRKVSQEEVFLAYVGKPSREVGLQVCVQVALDSGILVSSVLGILALSATKWFGRGWHTPHNRLYFYSRRYCKYKI